MQVIILNFLHDREHTRIFLINCSFYLFIWYFIRPKQQNHNLQPPSPELFVKRCQYFVILKVLIFADTNIIDHDQFAGFEPIEVDEIPTDILHLDLEKSAWNVPGHEFRRGCEFWKFTSHLTKDMLYL